jgi:hypothetical protein
MSSKEALTASKRIIRSVGMFKGGRVPLRHVTHQGAAIGGQDCGRWKEVDMGPSISVAFWKLFESLESDCRIELMGRMS